MRKLSVALDASVAEAAQRAAEEAGLSLSAWLNRAAESSLAVERGLEAVTAWERDHGDFTDEELADADRLLDEILAPGRQRRRRNAS